MLLLATLLALVGSTSPPDPAAPMAGHPCDLSASQSSTIHCPLAVVGTLRPLGSGLSGSGPPSALVPHFEVVRHSTALKGATRLAYALTAQPGSNRLRQQRQGQQQMAEERGERGPDGWRWPWPDQDTKEAGRQLHRESSQLGVVQCNFQVGPTISQTLA